MIRSSPLGMVVADGI